MEHQIRFPHLGIVLKNVGDGINIGGFEIKYYGMIIATGFLLGLIVSYYAAKHENKFDPELVFDYLITMIIPAIVGARLYYVIFSWDYYKNHLSEIIQIRNGGLAIYGGVIRCNHIIYLLQEETFIYASVWRCGGKRAACRSDSWTMGQFL